MIEIPKKEPLNIVPFIDVMLVLLAMVLSISTFIAKGEIAVTLPKAETTENHAAEREPIVLQADSSGTLYADGRAQSTEEIGRFIAALPKDAPVLLRIDAGARFENFVLLIDELKKNGHENFSIATEQKSGS
ncbi:MAG: Biopolymer transport protein ExbD [Burkholderia sp.]|jgi:biopolymer transport protein ExbD